MNRYYYVDEGGTYLNNSEEDKKYKIFMLSCVVVSDPDNIRLKITEKEELINNYYEYGELNFNGFHASENSSVPTIYNNFVSFLRGVPFRAYIVFIKKNSHCLKERKEQEDIYCTMIGLLFKNLFLKDEGDTINICFEENSLFKRSTALARYKAELDKVVKNINKGIDFNISIVTKKEKLLSITDYINSIFLKAYRRNIENFELRHYNSVKDKIGLIFNISDNIYYGDKKPLNLENNNKICD